MEIESKITKQTVNDRGDVDELIDIRIKISASFDDSLDDILMDAQNELAKRFRQMVAIESRTLPLRLQQAERWRQTEMFNQLVVAGAQGRAELDDEPDNGR